MFVTLSTIVKPAAIGLAVEPPDKVSVAPAPTVPVFPIVTGVVAVPGWTPRVEVPPTARAATLIAGFERTLVPAKFSFPLDTVVAPVYVFVPESVCVPLVKLTVSATFCGSVAHADPASEWCLATATLDGVLVAASDGAEREIAARDWFLGAMTTALHPGELLRAVRLPLLPATARFAFREFSRRAGDFALAATLVVLELDGGRMCRVRIGIGGAEDRPRRMAAAESALEGCVPSPEIFARAAQLVADALDPLEDASTSAQYRRDLAASLVRHALEEATA